MVIDILYYINLYILNMLMVDDEDDEDDNLFKILYRIVFFLIIFLLSYNI